MAKKRLALKVDCDTYEGSKTGIPNLLALFKEFNIKATFFFTLGPDTSGRAIFRVFTQKGFLKKMLRSNAAALYGPKTMMYGTLLPSPIIGEKLIDVMRSVEQQGHEVGVHGWDHIRWHDRLDKMTPAEIDRDYGQAHQMFEKVFGHKAHSSAAPGWHMTAGSCAVFKKYQLMYTSDTRGGSPFFPKVGEQIFSTLEIPSTLPTWDEMWGDPQFSSETDFLTFFRQAVQGEEVHSIHTELEATARLNTFRQQIELWKKDDVEFVTLETFAKEKLALPASIPIRSLHRVVIPNRGGFVSAGR